AFQGLGGGPAGAGGAPSCPIRPADRLPILPNAGLCCETLRRGRGLTHLWNRDMRRHVLGLMLIAGMAGCTSESDIATADKSGDITAAGPDSAAPTASLATRGSASSFASLPDRGELLSYGGVRKARTEGAYTWHPVS